MAAAFSYTALKSISILEQWAWKEGIPDLGCKAEDIS